MEELVKQGKTLPVCDKEASLTRGYSVAKNATGRAARLDPSLRKRGLLGMTMKPEQEFSPQRAKIVPCG